MKRLLSIALVLFHLVSFGPIRDVLAFSSQSTSFTLTSGALNEGGKDRIAISTKLWQDAIAEPWIGRVQSANYILTSGLISAIQSNQPILTQNIPYQAWQMNSSKDNAFDLDDYIQSPEGYPLSFTVSGNSKININIDPNTHIVNLSQSPDWYGVEKVYFYATDTQNSTISSNKVILQVENIQGQDKPVIVDIQTVPSIIKEGDLVKILVKGRDLDSEPLSFTYSDSFTETNRWQEGELWFSEATWQTSSNSTGHYTIKVTISDPTPLTDTESVLINIGNFNHPPVLSLIAALSFNEGGFSANCAFCHRYR